jgi:hypothetical protein
MVRVKDRDVTSREAIIGTNPLGTFGRWREEFPSKKSRVENLCARRLVGAAAGGPTAFAVGVLGVRTKFEKALRGGVHGTVHFASDDDCTCGAVFRRG